MHEKAPGKKSLLFHWLRGGVYIYEEDIFYSERISHFHMSFISDDDAEEKRYIASRFDITPVL